MSGLGLGQLAAHGFAKLTGAQLAAGATSPVAATASGSVVLPDGTEMMGSASGNIGATGATGRGISTVVRTSGTGAPGTTDTYTITYSDATTSTFGVYNGADGSGSGSYVLTGDTRLSDARTPTGSAGGVLSGTYPNPGFAVDMATQAELDAVATAKADAAHAHTAANISDSTAVGRAVLTAVDAAAARAAIGAGTSSTTGTVTGVTGTAPITSTGGTAPAIGITAATTSAAGSMSAADKTKLDGVASGATNYTHPANHPPSIITQDASNRFVTDTEKATWNAKQSTLVSGTDIKTLNGVSLLGSGGVEVGYLNIPQNSRSAAYTCALSDAGKHILHPSADTTARIFTIPANASVAFPIGTAVTFVNQNAGGVITIAITTDTMRLAGAGTTGSRTLAANGVATAIKLTATEWIISGSGLT